MLKFYKLYVRESKDVDWSYQGTFVGNCVYDTAWEFERIGLEVNVVEVESI